MVKGLHRPRGQADRLGAQLHRQLERQLAQDRALSQKQADTLDSIWERVT
jgi:hypothetical protein